MDIDKSKPIVKKYSVGNGEVKLPTEDIYLQPSNIKSLSDEECANLQEMLNALWQLAGRNLGKVPIHTKDEEI